MCSAAVAPAAAAAHNSQRRRPGQHDSVRAARKAQLMARCAATGAAAPPPSAGAAALTPSLALHPLVLERGCATSSLSRDKLSQQEQEMLIGMGAAIRALQQVRKGQA